MQISVIRIRGQKFGTFRESNNFVCHDSEFSIDLQFNNNTIVEYEFTWRVSDMRNAVYLVGGEGDGGNGGGGRERKSPTGESLRQK